MSDYKVEISLKHNEIPAITNVETGETRTLPRGNKSRDSVKFDLMPSYQRRYPKAWELLKTQTSDAEYKCADTLALMAKAYTNSLIPLNDDTTAVQLSEIFHVSRNIVSKYIDKLFKLGVIGKFEVYDANKIHHKYWVFNPYLSFNGDKIKRDISSLFDETTYALISGKHE